MIILLLVQVVRSHLQAAHTARPQDSTKIQLLLLLNHTQDNNNSSSRLLLEILLCINNSPSKTTSMATVDQTIKAQLDLGRPSMEGHSPNNPLVNKVLINSLV